MLKLLEGAEGHRAAKDEVPFLQQLELGSFLFGLLIRFEVDLVLAGDLSTGPKILQVSRPGSKPPLCPSQSHVPAKVTKAFQLAVVQHKFFRRQI